jgi:hypothetical protein
MAVWRRAIGTFKNLTFGKTRRFFEELIRIGKNTIQLE